MAGADSYTTQLLAFPSRVVVSGIGGVGGTNANNVTLTNLIDGAPYILEVCSVNNAGSSCLDFNVSGGKLLLYKHFMKSKNLLNKIMNY